MRFLQVLLDFVLQSAAEVDVLVLNRDGTSAALVGVTVCDDARSYEDTVYRCVCYFSR